MRLILLSEADGNGRREEILMHLVARIAKNSPAILNIYALSTAKVGCKSRQFRRYQGRLGRRASGCHNRERMMSGIPTAAGKSQNAIGGSSFQSGRFFPLST